jgi:hypothetical protein
MLDPNLANARRLRALPKCEKSSVDIAELSLASPYTEVALPNLATLRRLTLDPNEKKSSREKALPNLTVP